MYQDKQNRTEGSKEGMGVSHKLASTCEVAKGPR